ncbi:ThiF family adenylyltransferase [Bacillus salitolerans]|uniref:ThiF family adenylyltransferase n=1 Tax=Bacillus salitolerans TaxID=1437434 RepID=A0ABW4LQZ9_9BACI
MKLKSSLNFRAHPEKSTVSFHDGEEKELYVDDLDGFWDLLKILSIKEYSENSHEIRNWKNKYGYGNKELRKIIQFLNYNGLLYKPNDKFSDDLHTRNFNYFSAFDKSESAHNILDKISSSTIMIVGIGTIGATLAVALANLGVKKIILIDPDIVELKNIPAQLIFTKNDVGQKKVDVIKNRIITTFPEHQVETLEIEIKTVEDLSIIHNIHKIDFLFNCFDTATETLHKDIVAFTSKLNINYILMGYHYDSIIAYQLGLKNGNKLIEESFKEFNEELVISVNRGTVFQCIAGTLMGIKLFISTLLNNENVDKANYLQFDLNSFTIDKEEPLNDKSNNDHFITSLKELYPIENTELTKEIRNLKQIIEQCNVAEEDHTLAEAEIVSLFNFFEILLELDSLKDLNLEETYSSFMSFLNEIDETSDNNEENLYKVYHETIDQIENAEEVNLYTLTSKLRTYDNYQIRVNSQKRIFDAISRKSGTLLNLLKSAKTSQINIYNEVNLKEVLGLNKSDISIFEKTLLENYADLFLNFYKLFYPQEKDGSFDFLAHIDEEDIIFGDINDAMEILQHSFDGSYDKHHLESYLNEIHSKNYIKVVDPAIQKNVNKTVFFPLKKQNRIVLTYDNTYNSLFTYIHEFGHSYYNQYYGSDYFNKSNRTINEVLALFFEIKTIFGILDNQSIRSTYSKELMIGEYIERISKLLLSNFAINYLESKVIEQILNNNEFKLTLQDFLNMQEQVDNVLFEDIPLKNAKNNYLNILLYPYFIFNFKDYIVDPIALLIASYLYKKYQSNPMLMEYKLKSFLVNSTEIDMTSFCREILNRELSEEFINEMLDNFRLLINKLNDIKLTSTELVLNK